MPQNGNRNGGSGIRRAIRVAGLVGALLALSGCVVVPAYYPRYAYRPYRPHYYYYP
jgi:hypothetical protein